MGANLKAKRRRKEGETFDAPHKISKQRVFFSKVVEIFPSFRTVNPRTCLEMPAVPFRRTFVPASRLPRWLRSPSPTAECIGWLLVAACLIGNRWFVAAHLPTYVWTRDSGSYLAPATAWMQTGHWITSARRGPVYSLFIAAILNAGGTLATIATAQTVIGALTAFLTIWMARVWLGRRAIWPLLVCSLFYTFYGMPLELERLIRNETLLTLFSTVAFGAWFFALRRGSVAWVATSGFFTGLMQLLKGIFPVFPLIVTLLIVWNWRHRPRRAVVLASCYLLLFSLPLFSSKLYNRLSGTTRPPEPEDGQMFYGRTAQWTYLEGGIVPDIKTRIHDQATAYGNRFRRTGKLDNNEIVKRTVIPSLKTILIDERGQTLVDVNRLCWKLGLEAVAHHPGAYARQFGHDLYYLNFISAQRFVVFQPKQLTSAMKDADKYAEAHATGDAALIAWVFDLPQAHAVVKKATAKSGSLVRYSRFVKIAGWLRLLSPVFLTTLSLPLLVWIRRGRERLFWMGSALLWFYYLVLLSTVGRPLDRYLMPVVPLMFWAITAALTVGLNELPRLFRQDVINGLP